MKKLTTITLCTIVLFLLSNCNSKKSPSELEIGFYRLSSSVSTSDEISNSFTEINFRNATLFVKSTDSLEFIGDQNIAGMLWDHNTFKYKIDGNTLILSDRDFVEKIKFEINEDSLLKLEVNTKDFESISFEHLKMNLEGKYAVYGFTVNENVQRDEDFNRSLSLFNDNFLIFSDTQIVKINTPLAQLITNNYSSLDSVFSYQIIGNELLLANQNSSVKVPFVYDGEVRLFINNRTFNKLDLGKVN